MRESALRGAVVAVGAMFASCLDPTEIEVVVSTDLSCDVVVQNGVAIAIGEPNDDTTGTNANTHECSDGGVGTLVVIPHGGVTGTVGIRVMLGVDASVEQCDAVHGFAGCVVARRSLSFIPHHPLTIPIELQSACLGRTCSPDSTCFDGDCVDASVTCDGASCDLPDTGTPPPACQPVAATAVETGALANTPHIVRNPNGGYVLMWVRAQGTNKEIVGAQIDPSGVAGASVGLVTPQNSVGVTGPLGTDGTSLAAFYFDQTSLLSVIGATTDGGTSVVSSAGVLPLDGVVADGAGVYEALFTYLTTTQIYTIDTRPTPLTITPSSVPAIDLTNTTGYGLARAGSTTFLSFARTTDSKCHVATCVASACTDLAFDNCPAIRTSVASESSWVSYAATSGMPTLSVHAGSTTNDVLLNAVPAQPPAGIPLVTSNAVYAFVRTQAEDLVRFDGTATVTPVATGLGYSSSSGLGAGFDVVADDPRTLHGYAIVYWMASGGGGTPGTGSIYFTHVCP